jgi:hypothetical protein
MSNVWRSAANVLLGEGYGVEDIAIKMQRMGVKSDTRYLEEFLRDHVQVLRSDGRLRSILKLNRRRRVGAVRKDERSGDHQQAEPPEEGDLP